MVRTTVRSAAVYSRLNEPYRARFIAELTEARMPAEDTVAYTAKNAVEVYRLLRLVLCLSLSTILP